ncbi:Flagellar hook-associated protein 1 [Hyphomicrobiales bacterium]|nr:Flagellar hook-associated protein 1 [Hyphomicrobiales bacterium]CAH1700132.1 Flagellar hook-associated protein 1 [Hyphomicrobiales bacterium]CAI0343894.1 flagellar hook-associated protein 1 FlgK [Hyphomicrobiales bacterium]
MGLSTSLSTAIGGLNATQVGIGVVSQNVANAGTTGYVRRSVSTADSLSGLTIGVQNTQVQRLLDKIVQHQLWQEASGGAYTSTRASAMSNLDKLYGAPGSATALDTIFSQFTGALQSLQNDPSSYSLRSQVIDSAAQLARQLNTLSDGVQTLRSQAESGIANGVAKVNDLLGALTKVNSRIVAAPNDSSTASLKDQRDLILSELSQYVDIKTTEDARGSISIITGSGTQLFDGQAAVTFSFDEHTGLDADDQWNADPTLRGVGTIKMKDASGNVSDAIVNRIFRSGEIAANLELRDKTLVQAQAQLDEIAAHLAEALGSGGAPIFVDGAGNTPYAGAADKLGFAGRIAVNDDIIQNRALLIGPVGTASGDATRPAALLKALTQDDRNFAALGLDGSTTPTTGTIANFVQRVVSSQGQAVEAAKRLDEGQQVALASIQSRFQETAQVNVDQEMSMLIELQTAYAANARIISTVKEMMDVLLRV